MCLASYRGIFTSMMIYSFLKLAYADDCTLTLQYTKGEMPFAASFINDNLQQFLLAVGDDRLHLQQNKTHKRDRYLF